MTNTDTELYELCKQVYEATRWAADMDKGVDYVWCHETLTRLPIDWDTSDFHQHIPLYTSDYLLEKLPSRLIFHNNDCAIEVRRTKKDKYMWSANIRHSYGQYFKQISDTPLKALLKLTLKLHEEKIL